MLKSPFNNLTNKGSIFAISWPETLIYKTTAWYDTVTTIMGFCKNGYYSVGHAALLLVEYTTGKVYYFDFGRYQSPVGYGRVRDMYSDPELEIKTSAVIIDNKIQNIEAILSEVYNNNATHGDGRLMTSLTNNIDFDCAYSKAKEIQSRGAVPYGPFKYKGSNCSRFIASVYMPGIKNIFQKLRINISYLYCKTPTSNIIATSRVNQVFVIKSGKFYIENSIIIMFFSNKTTTKPTVSNNNHSQIPKNALKLYGIGCSSYFEVNATKNKSLFDIKSYNEQGGLEFAKTFQMLTLGFDINHPFTIAYISNALSVKIKQRDRIFEFKCTNKVITPISNFKLKVLKNKNH